MKNKTKDLENITSSEDKWKKLLSDIPKIQSTPLQGPNETNQDYQKDLKEYNSIYNN